MNPRRWAAAWPSTKIENRFKEACLKRLPGMGTEVRRDRRLGGRLHMERPEETRQRVGGVGAAADRAVVKRLAGTHVITVQCLGKRSDGSPSQSSAALSITRDTIHA